MTEYWVSQAKYHCKYCNVWMQDNKMSRTHHDNGVKHKERVDMFNKKKRDDKFHGMRSEQELRKQMDMIERSAKEAMTADRNAAIEEGQVPPPSFKPGFRSADLAEASSAHSGRHQRYPPGAVGRPGFRTAEKSGDAASDNLRQDSTGTYTVKGITYYEGQFHEDKLRTGVECEIFNEAEDEWLPARIIARKEFPIPYTDKIQLYVDVRYSTDLDLKPSDIPMKDDGEEQDGMKLSVEKDVKSDRLRLQQAEDGTVGVVEVEPLEVASAPPVVESTGFGMWQTVAVRTVDEEQERRQLEDQEKELEEDRVSGRAVKASIVDENTESGDVLKAYDPYNRGVYKGIKVSRECTETEIESLAKGKSVSFKKRKVNGGLAKKVGGAGEAESKE